MIIKNRQKINFQDIIYKTTNKHFFFSYYLDQKVITLLCYCQLPFDGTSNQLIYAQSTNSSDQFTLQHTYNLHIKHIRATER